MHGPAAGEEEDSSSMTWPDADWTVESVMAKLRGDYNAPIFIDSWVAADDKNSTRHILQVGSVVC